MTGERRQESAGYVGYEYREISVPREYASLCLDSYPCFGWEEDPNQGRPGRRRSPAIPAAPGPKEMETLCFRRARSISGKAELTRLQRNFDSCIAELRALERSKTTRGAGPRPDRRRARHRLYGRLHLCGGIHAARRLADNPAGYSRFPGVDPPVFSVQGHGAVESRAN